MTYPIVKIRPGKGRRLAAGAPWAYADEIAMDRRTRALAPGALVHLVEGEDSFGLAAMNPASQVAARLLDRDPEARIDQAWFETRFHRALTLRETLFDQPFYRLVHAEGDGLPGLVIDRFGDALVIQPNAAWIDALIEPALAAARQVTGCETVMINATSRIRGIEGLESYQRLASGQISGPIAVPMNGATYLADLAEGQKTGMFFDQRPNHAFATKLKPGRVLDVFCHVGGFGLAALAQGAEEVLAVDSSAPALNLAEQGAGLTGVQDRFTTRRSDGFKAMEDLALAGEWFDMVICDPPAFAPSKSTLSQGLRAYRRLARLAAALVRPGGWIVLCSCSHAADPASFLRASADGLREAGAAAQLVHSGRAGPDHPQHPHLPENSYLKALFFRVDG